MTTATLNKQLKALRDVVRGAWVKFNGSYYTNAFEAIVSEVAEDYIKFSRLSDYQIGVTKDDDRWFVFAEDHEPDEIAKLGYQPENGFKTLAEAKISAEAFGGWFESLWIENNMEA